ncbi:methyltransferase domain-containing protein [Nitrospina gracilis]|nr:methyltransferase domain-containing protein [Nitrospina gracilis]
MSGWYEKYYWRTGFKSRLYDRLTPESYLESMRKVVALLPDKQGLKIWDAGCGTGLLLLFLENAVKQGMIYYGSDLLSAGLSQVRMRARDLRASDRVACVQSDFTEASVFKENLLDVVVAHFSIYTIRKNDKRQQALKNMYRVLKPGGLLIVCCPSENYDAGKIIEESCELLRARRGLMQTAIKRMFFYPFTKGLGLNFIQKQLQSGQWRAYTHKELTVELRCAGFEIGHSETVYAGGAYLMCGHKGVTSV